MILLLITTIMTLFLVGTMIFDYFLIQSELKKINIQLKSITETTVTNVECMNQVNNLMSECHEEVHKLKDKKLTASYQRRLGQCLELILSDENGIKNLKLLKLEIHTQLVKEDPHDPFVNTIDDLLL